MLVIACPRCRRARIVEEGRKSAACPSCARPLDVRDLRAAYRGDSLAEAQQAAGLVNARLAGREGEFLSALVVPEPPEDRHDNRWNAAAAAARKAHGESARADAVARALGEFEDGELAAAFEIAGLRQPSRHLQRMLETQVVHEPRPGLFRALG